MEKESNIIKPVITNAQDYTLYSSLYDATYHSMRGAVQESKHVFIENGLKYIFDQFPSEKINILEIGFGTGLNAMLTIETALASKRFVNYTGVEKHPVSTQLFLDCNYENVSSELAYKAILKLHQDKSTKLTEDGKYSLHILTGDFNDLEIPEKFHLIYLDAFAPNVNSDIWNENVYSILLDLLCENGAFVTFCAQGQFKRDLKHIGFKVEVLPGALGKREMTRAIKV